MGHRGACVPDYYYTSPRKGAYQSNDLDRQRKYHDAPKLIANIVYKHVCILFLTYIHTWNKSLIVYKRLNNEGCTRNLLHTDTFSIVLSQLCVTSSVWDVNCLFLYFKHHFSTSGVIIQQTRKRKHYLLIRMFIVTSSVHPSRCWPISPAVN
jgi:hypothetical protein